MSTIGKIVVGLEAESSRFSAPLQQAGRDVSSLRENVERLKKAEGGSDFFDKLREGAGRRSALGETSELLRGGGPISGLTGAAEAIKGMAEQAKTLKEQFQSGKLSAGELAEKLISSVPVVGQFWQAGRAIRELFTNEGQDLALAEQQAKALEAALKAQTEIFDILKADAKDYEEHLAQIAHEIAQATGTEAERKAEQSRFDERKSHDEIDKKRAEELAKVREASAPAIKAARDAAAALQPGDTSGKLTFWEEFTTSNGDALAARKERSQQADITRIIAARALQAQREAEAEINRRYDDLETQEKVKTAVIQKAEVAKAVNQQSIFSDKAEQENNSKRREDAERDAKEIADATTETNVARLRAQGDTLGAEKLQLKKQLADRLDAIKKEAEEEMALRSAYDLQGRLAVAKTAADKIQAAENQTQALMDQAQAEADLKNQKDLSKRDDSHSAAEVRRFDFNLGKSQKPSGVQGQILETEKKHALDTARIKFIQEQFYNNMLNKPQVILYNF